jgi:hypothetical protein
VEVDERHRAGEPGDDIGNPILDACSARFGVLGERRVNLRPVTYRCEFA